MEQLLIYTMAFCLVGVGFAFLATAFDISREWFW